MENAGFMVGLHSEKEGLKKMDHPLRSSDARLQNYCIVHSESHSADILLSFTQRVEHASD